VDDYNDPNREGKCICPLCFKLGVTIQKAIEENSDLTPIYDYLLDKDIDQESNDGLDTNTPTGTIDHKEIYDMGIQRQL